MDLLVIAVGVALVVGLGEVAIRQALVIARHCRLDGSFVGLTILSVGTSLPEITAHVVGSAAILAEPQRLPELSGLLLGTNLGSDIFQQNFILPTIGLVGTVLVIRSELNIQVGALVLASLLVWVLATGDGLNRLEGLVLMAAYAGYLAHLLRHHRAMDSVATLPAVTPGRPRAAAVLLVVAFAVMAVVTDRVVDAASHLVTAAGLSASFVGVVLLGVATALPELTTSLIGLARGERGISAGILIGSNITNPLLGIGLGAAISTYAVPQVVLVYDLPVKIATAGILYAFLRYREDLNRFEAVTLIGLFAAYVILRPQLFPTDF